MDEQGCMPACLVWDRLYAAVPRGLMLIKLVVYEIMNRDGVARRPGIHMDAFGPAHRNRSHLCLYACLLTAGQR
jgi:hypothetical protein